MKRIPKITIKDNIISVRINSKLLQFKRDEIKEIEEVEMTDFLFSNKGGMKISTTNDQFIFPYHIYSNQTQLLNVFDSKVQKITKWISGYSIGNIKYNLYIWRNPTLIYLSLSSVLLTILVLKGRFNLISFLSLSTLITICLVAFLLTNHYVKVKKTKILHITPILFKTKYIDVNTIKYISFKNISNGKMGLKTLFIKLKNNEIISLNAGLNSHQELKEIAQIITQFKIEK